MRTLLLFLVLFHSVLILQGQLTYAKRGESINSKKAVFLSLEIENYEDIFRELPFKVVEIIDSTNSNGIYGTLIKGISQTKRPAKFKNGLNNEFEKFIRQYSFHNPLGKNIKMVVTKLEVMEQSTIKKSNGSVIFGVNYYADNELYFKDFLTRTEKSIGVTKQHDQVLKELIGLSLENLAEKILSK